MPKNLRLLRRKIRTTENIWQITRAMSMVSAVQLRRVQQRVEERREYFNKLTGIIGRISASETPIEHPYLVPVQEETRRGLIIVAGDRGMCGSYNSTILKLAEDFVRNAPCIVDVIPVGARAVSHCERRGMSIIDRYEALRDMTDADIAARASRQIREHFDTGQLSSLHIAYTEFQSTSRHIPIVRQLLPVEENTGECHAAVEYILEPDPAAIINTLIPMAVDAELRYYLLQALASENAARMVAMTASTDNAEELKGHLIKELNRARQQKITDEMLEIVSGAEALGG